jgi:DNA-directed RNA polymerase I subunit RPA49
MEKVKKRKSEEDGSSRPSKRVAIEEDQQIHVSLLESDGWAPVVGMHSTLRKETQQT